MKGGFVILVLLLIVLGYELHKRGELSSVNLFPNILGSLIVAVMLS